MTPLLFLAIVKGKVPSYLGTSVAFVGAVAAIRAQGGTSAEVTGAMLVAGAALTQTALNLARPVTSYRLLALDAPEAAVGWATAAYALLPLLGALWMGRATDRLPSAVPLVAAGALTMGAGGAGLALATSAPAVYAASAVLGVGHLAFTIAGQAAIARRAGPGLAAGRARLPRGLARPGDRNLAIPRALP